MNDATDKPPAPSGDIIVQTKAGVTRRLTEEARERIAEAARKRWELYRAGKGPMPGKKGPGAYLKPGEKAAKKPKRAKKPKAAKAEPKSTAIAVVHAAAAEELARVHEPRAVARRTPGRPPASSLPGHTLRLRAAELRATADQLETMADSLDDLARAFTGHRRK